MGDRPTLILTTRLGVRPLGVRGDALHNVAGQLLAVIRRRLGEGPANLLAEPQLREGGDGIDWYAARSGEVRRFADLSESERAATLETVETRLGRHPVPGRGAEGIDGQRRGAPDRPLARACHGAPVRRLHLPGRWRAGDRGLGLRGRRCRGPRRLRAAARAGTGAACAGGAGERARGRAARPACLGAVAERAAVRPAAPAAAPDHLVAAARLRPGRSFAQHRHLGDARSARARAAARSHAAPEGLARFGGGRPEQAQGRARRPRGRAQGQGGDVQADRAAQAATSSATATGGQGAAASAAATAGRRAAGAAGAAAPTGRRRASCPATGRAIRAARASRATDTIWGTGPDSWASTTTCM